MTKTGDPPIQMIARRREGTSVTQVGTSAARGSGAAAGTDDGMQPPGGCDRHRHNVAQNVEYPHGITDETHGKCRGRENSARTNHDRQNATHAVAERGQRRGWGQAAAAEPEINAAAPLRDRGQLIRMLSTMPNRGNELATPRWARGRAPPELGREKTQPPESRQKRTFDGHGATVVRPAGGSQGSAPAAAERACDIGDAQMRPGEQ